MLNYRLDMHDPTMNESYVFFVENYQYFINLGTP
jgi:hypothetical protein